MVNDLLIKTIHNLNTLENLAYYQNIQSNLQQECQNHLAILLGESKTTSILINGHFVKKPYKKCLLCGKDISFSGDISYEFDARDLLKKEEETFEDWNIRYNIALHLFLDICNTSESRQEAYHSFNKILHDKSMQKILKKPIPTEK